MTAEIKPGGKFGDFTVVRLLGKGGMGRVYLLQRPNGEMVAAKILDASDGDETALRRFLREAHLALGVKHRNIVETFGIGVDRETGLNYILMEYVPGGSLADRIRDEGPLPISDAVRITYQIVGALELAQRKGIVHRDIKPANILFGADGTAKLSDLGIARKLQGADATTVTQAGAVIGTPAYMSPEQMLNSHEVDTRADIYSLGIVFYEMLTGARPNRDDTAVQLMAKAVAGEPIPDVRRLRPEVSASVAHLISMMCAMNLDERIATPSEVAYALVDIANGKKFRDRNLLSTVARRLLRGRSALLLGTLLAIAAFGVVFVYVEHRLSTTAKPQPVVVETPQPLASKPRPVDVEPRPGDGRVQNRVFDGQGCTMAYYVEHGEAIAGYPVLRDARNPASAMTYREATETDCLQWKYDPAPCALEPGFSADVRLPAVVDGRLPLTKIGPYAFNWAKGLRSIAFDEGVREIGQCAFYHCPDLESVVLPDSVVRIDPWAFFCCPNLKTVRVGSGLRTSAGAFFLCPLARVELSGENPKYAVRNESLYAGSYRWLDFHTPTRPADDLPANLRVIGARALQQNPIRRLVLPDALESARIDAFMYCPNLEEVVFGSHLKSLGRTAFRNSPALRVVRFLGDAPEYVDPGVFTYAAKDIVVVVERCSKGWNGPGTTDLPDKWPVGSPNPRPIRYATPEDGKNML